MIEPTLEDISDYNTLSGQKRRVVWAVILSGLIIGAVYVASYHYFGKVNDSIPVKENIGKIPLK